MPIKVINAQATCANLKKLLEEKGFTPNDVKERLNLESVQSIYKWYSTANGKGTCIPSTDNLVILANLLGVPMDSIIVTNDVLNGIMNP